MVLSPRFCTPVSFPPLALSSHVIAGRLAVAAERGEGQVRSFHLEIFTRKTLPPVG